MLSRTLRRALQEKPSSLSLSSSTSSLPPTYLLPLRARLSTTPQTISPPEASLPTAAPLVTQTASRTPAPPTSPSIQTQTQTPPPSEPQTKTEPHPSLATHLPLLAAQPPHYITAHIHGHPYLLTTGDTLRLPFRMPGVAPGDVLRLNKATHLGSRDYTLRAPPSTKGTRESAKVVRYLDEGLFECRATVVGVESEPMRVMEKTKRRQRHVRHVRSKHRYTVLRVSEVVVKGVGDLEGVGGGDEVVEKGVEGLE